MTEQHRSVTGNALRAAVLGANDGLVSNLNLIMGVAGAELPGRSILITGLAGLLAGAISMALGEWVSVQSARELAKRELAIETREIREKPEQEEAELVAIFQAKGVSETEARQLAARMMNREQAVLDTMAREELGINPKDLGGSAGEAAGTSFALFVIGALIPVLPFAFLAGRPAIVTSLIASSAGLLALGAAIGWLNNMRIGLTAARQLIFGLSAAAITFALGALVGSVLLQGDVDEPDGLSCRGLEPPPEDKNFRTAPVLGILAGASIGGIGLPIGSTPSLLLVSTVHRLYGADLDFGCRIVKGLPLVLVQTVAAWF